jgi:acyl carrier protein
VTALGANSLNMVKLEMALENNIGIHISDEQAEKIATVLHAIELNSTQLHGQFA